MKRKKGWLRKLTKKLKMMRNNLLLSMVMCQLQKKSIIRKLPIEILSQTKLETKKKDKIPKSRVLMLMRNLKKMLKLITLLSLINKFKIFKSLNFLRNK